MPLDAAAVSKVIDAWPSVPDLPAGADDAVRRWHDAVTGLSGGSAAAGDVAALTRQLLLEDESRFGGRARLRVPTTPPWPDLAQWRAAGCDAVESDGRVVVTAREWLPPLAEGEDRVAAAAQVQAVYAGDRDARAVRNQLPADPFWTETVGHTSYRSASQRAAARTLALAPEGSTVAVVLPTGQGKTAVIWSRALLRSAGVTVVVVPTVVLALDMERRTRELSAALPRPLSPVDRFAYVGSLDDEAKRALREAIRSGEQRLVYTSPEALMGGLREAVLTCARSGLLRQFVVDEAHIIDQWGQDFRPEFLTMAALHEQLLAQSPTDERPVTLLLSATLTSRHLAMLSRTFSSPCGTHVVWGSSLRTEPAYFVRQCGTAEERRDLVLDAVRRLPRPLVLYVSKVADAVEWRRVLRENGFRRVAAVTGSSSDAERRSAVQKWRGGATDGGSVRTEFDIVVGTSAFGLGIDVDNVRSVVHACIPETVDRFYQEVGRAGRDGRPTVSLLATDPGDEEIARTLNQVVLIGSEKGWSRWCALRDSGEALADGRLRLDLNALPRHLVEGYGRSAQWNVRVLTLMAQAGLISLSAPSAPERELGEGDAQWRDRLEAFYEASRSTVDIRVVNGAGLSAGPFAEAISAARDELSRAQAASLQAMHDVLRADACAGAVLARHYRVLHEDGELRTDPVCRGCPACRRRGAVDEVFPVEPRPDLPATGEAGDPLRFGLPRVFLSWAEPSEYDDLVPDLLERLAAAGAHVFHCADAALLGNVQRRVRDRPVLHDRGELLVTYEGLVTVVLEPWAAVVPGLVRERWDRELPTYVLGPAALPAPDKPQWSWRELADAHLSVRSAVRSL